MDCLMGVESHLRQLPQCSLAIWHFQKQAEIGSQNLNFMLPVSLKTKPCQRSVSGLRFYLTADGGDWATKPFAVLLLDVGYIQIRPDLMVVAWTNWIPISFWLIMSFSIQKYWDTHGCPHCLEHVSTSKQTIHKLIIANLHQESWDAQFGDHFT